MAAPGEQSNINWMEFSGHPISCFTYIIIKSYNTLREEALKSFIRAPMNNTESTVRSESVLGCQMLWVEGQIRKRPVSVLMEM